MNGVREDSPDISLCLKERDHGSSCVSLSLDTSPAALAVLKRQDEQYRSQDYLDRRSRRKDESRDSASCYDVDNILGGDSGVPPQGDDMIDAICREKMCEWGYRISDHFHTSREIVAYAFSFLDRFVDRCNCDRTAFKLASMTSIYMATKIFNSKQMSIASLAELSRGEFSFDHIAEMERIILQTLDWKLCPPTVQTFVDCLQTFVPYDDEAINNAVYQRANFFAELAVYEYSLVTKTRLEIAVSCILNAMECIDDSFEMKRKLVKDVEEAFSAYFTVENLDSIQRSLWFLYSCSAQLAEDYTAGEPMVRYPSKQHVSRQRSLSLLEHSPTSVHTRGRF